MEGRDSLKRLSGSPTAAHNTHKPVQHADSGRNSRPQVKALPLRTIQRPDGQSPPGHFNDAGSQPVYSPHSMTSSPGFSQVLQKTQLFPSRTPSQMDLPVNPDFEYDDSIYVPDLPGSYFSMDPGAYTLTWQHKGTGIEPHAKQKIDSPNQGSFC